MVYDIFVKLQLGCYPVAVVQYTFTQTTHRTTQNKQYIEQHTHFGRLRACPVFASYTLAFALQLRKKHGKTSVRLAEECQLAR